MGRLVRQVGALLTACLVLAAPASAEAIRGTNGAAVPELDWGPCEAGVPEEVECATAEVPLSYRDPGGQSLELALGRLPATDPENRVGTLFWNPGGPGGSGRIPRAFTPLLRERFDIVGFDPRGIAASTPLQCFASDEEAEELLGWEFPITLAQERDVIARTQEATERCAENGGPLLRHMGTGNVARDLDLLRQAVGDEQLTFLGFSYGTFLGQVYANLFPDRVRALALDAVLGAPEWTVGREPEEAFVPMEARLRSFEGARDALTTFLAICAADARCAFREAGRDLQAKFDLLLERLRRQPLELVDPETGERTTITFQTVVGFTYGLLYNPANAALLADTLQAFWLATEQRRAGRPVRLRERVREAVLEAPALPGKQEPEEYAGFEWYQAVVCLDSSHPRNPWSWPRFARAADRDVRGFGPLLIWSTLACATWPASDEDRYWGPWDREPANPLLLIGNSGGDPATPYEDSVAAERELADARLLTLDSYGHTAVRTSGCVRDRLERYLVALELPPPGTVCQPDRAPFDPPPTARAAALAGDALR